MVVRTPKQIIKNILFSNIKHKNYKKPIQVNKVNMKKLEIYHFNSLFQKI